MADAVELAPEPHRPYLPNKVEAELKLPWLWTTMFLLCWALTLCLTGSMVYELHQLNTYLGQFVDPIEITVETP